MPKDRALREINEQLGGRSVVINATTSSGGGAAKDHGQLAGLSDDDHPQYLDTARHAAIDADVHGSGTATDGQVLTADGAGGTAWAAGGGSPDASAVTYTPTTATDWDADTDPGNVDGALDQLAERVDDLEAGGGGGATVFTDLTDVPSSYSGQGGKYVRVNSGATGLEFVTLIIGLAFVAHPITLSSIAYAIA